MKLVREAQVIDLAEERKKREAAREAAKKRHPSSQGK